MPRSDQQRKLAAKALAEAASRGHGITTPPGQQILGMRWLRQRGCTLAEIARLYDVSAETVRTRLAALSTHALTADEWDVIQALRAGRIRDANGTLSAAVLAARLRGRR